MFIYILIGLAVAFLGYVRFAPSAPAQWHVPIAADGAKDLDGGAIRVVADAGDTMAQLEAAMKALPRTSVLAGSAAQRHVTFITRSKWIGFPDYTTLEKSGDQIKIFARLRFGRKDFGVNAARLEGLLAGLN